MANRKPGRSRKTSGGLSPKDIKYTGEITGVEDLVKVKHPDVYRGLKATIAQFHAKLGVQDRSIKIADMEDEVSGAHLINGLGENAGIYLNKKMFNQPKKKIIADIMKSYSPATKRNAYSWTTKTNDPLGHVLTHELAHGVWSRFHTSPKHKAAGKEIFALFNQYKNDAAYRRKKGYGIYSLHNASEFFAEVSTKAIHGNDDNYTRKLKKIIKRYKL